MIFLVDLPKPVHGMSNVNLYISKLLRDKTNNIRVINTAPSFFYRFFGSKLWVVLKFIHFIYVFFNLLISLVQLRHGIVYRSISGGIGQIYDIFYALLIRVFGLRLIVHHHSFNYINSSSLLFYLFIKVCDQKKTSHVVLGDVMKTKLSKKYNIDFSSIMVVSNSAFYKANSDFLDKNVTFKQKNTLTLGHLANLSYEKGIEDFYLIAKGLKNMGVDLSVRLAGPTNDNSVKSLIDKMKSEFHDFLYYDGIYGEDKKRFFKNLDLFIFMSRYKNEAEPLVLYEAGEFGVVNIGSQAGCMKEVIEKLGGLSFCIQGKSIEFICLEIFNFLQDGNLSLDMKAKREKLFLEFHRKSESQLNLLIEDLIKYDSEFRKI
jgi:glycosyltransferase involved in cell wall biosynthesis